VLPPAIIWQPSGEPLGKGIVPPGALDRLVLPASSDNGADRAYANWLCLLLPFVEEAALETSIDYSQPIGHPRNKAARGTDLAVLKCPSDPHSGAENHYQRIPDMGVADEGYARSNFAMNGGTNETCLMPGKPSMKCTDGFWIEGDNLATNVRAVWGSGIGGTNKSLPFRAFPRGLSTMVAVDEIRAGVNSIDPRGVWALGFVGSSATAGHGLYRKCGRPNNPSVESDLVSNCERVRASVGGAEALAAMGMGCKTWYTSGANFEAGARSLHPGGVNLLMLGGSVHFVADDVDEQIWHNMHRRDFKGQLDLPF
jgi:prepilin-type processing-associated H-X9-DG protein